MKISGKIKTVLEACAITVLAALVSGSVLNAVFAISTSTPSGEDSDFNITDVYNSVLNGKGTPTLSSDIVIVGVDKCSRSEIADIISLLDSCNTAALGLDIIFPWENLGDSSLVDAIESCTNLVLPYQIQTDPRTDSIIVAGSYFYTDSIINRGVVSLEAKSNGGIVRDLRISYGAADVSYPSLAAALATVVSPSDLERFDSRAQSLYPIYYPNIKFEVIDPSELFNDFESLAPYLEGKVVLLGDVNDAHDHYMTPIYSSMPGVMIHAYALQTILDGSYIRSTSSFVNWLFAVLFCWLFIMISILAKNHLPDAGSIVVRVIQLVCLYVFYLVGCVVFEKFRLYIDFMPALSMIALGLLAFDIWGGLVAIFKSAVIKLKNKK